MNNLKLLAPLLTFAEVVNKQSFTLASQSLGMSKSAVSQQVKRLEEHTGQQLLSRHTRGMSLTAAGERLLARCELLQEQVALAFDEIAYSKEEPSGPFAITLPHSCETNIVIPALNQLCTEFPKIEPRLVVTDQTQDLIRDKLDVAIYAGELKDSNYRALPIGASDEVFCVSPIYLQKHGPIEALDDVMKQRWISAPWQRTPITLRNKRDLGDELQLDLHSTLETNTLTSTLDMVLREMGIALLPEFVLKNEFKNGRLVRLLPEYHGRHWPFHLVHRFHGEKPAHITRFHQLVKYFFGKTDLQ
ncbi:LysR family transcriptional regulator [Neptuniibacter sp.]|uniref:LysR family transcriptional regulator n=1 Tax=Neptuniibacter sp. TaxID=1962643 RepID=UPI0026108C4F|nr:LysR family transcriptional regulator [Neptuniibacter sp.]MCP4598905.1 LysR family transcriptional regulator [Neptuniibacter sp.]